MTYRCQNASGPAPGSVPAVHRFVHKRGRAVHGNGAAYTDLSRRLWVWPPVLLGRVRQS